MKSSICQTCFNFECSWHKDFKPVEGWKADPTIVLDSMKTYSSYNVEYCPLYIARNGYKPITCKELATMYNTSIRTTMKRLKTGKLIDMLKQQGYELLILVDNDSKYAKYYIKQIGGNKCRQKKD